MKYNLFSYMRARVHVLLYKKVVYNIFAKFAMQKLWYTAPAHALFSIPTTTCLNGHYGHRWYIEIHCRVGHIGIKMVHQ